MNDIGMDLYIAYEDGYKAGYAEAERKKKCKPKTNADRIRAMTDEELAEWLEEIQIQAAKAYGNDTLLLQGELRKFWLDWLRQEATDG